MPANEVIAYEKDALIARCKDRIAYRANMAGLRFNQDDIVCTQESDGTNVIFLRRFFIGYKTNEDGDRILNEDGDPIPNFQPTAWFEYRKRHTEVVGIRSGIFEIVPPRLVMRYPWLFIIAKDNQIISDGGNYNALPESDHLRWWEL